jgi:hypothetical protein
MEKQGTFPNIKRYAPFILTVLVLLFVLQRFGVILFGYTHISHPAFDESVSGVLPSDLLDGHLRAPFFAYQYENRSGDSLIEGFMLVPFFKVFGRAIFSIKAFSVFSALMCLLGWIVFIKRYQGIWTALVFAALFAFPPPMFTRLNVTGTVDSHHIINMFIPIQLLFLFRIIEGDKEKILPWFWFGLGFFSGLGMYAFYTYIIFNGFCALFFLIVSLRKITLSRILTFSIGFFVGFFPWLGRSLYSRAGGHYLTSVINNIHLSISGLIQVFGYNVPHSLGFAYPSREIGFLSIIYYCFILIFTGVLVGISSRGLSYKNGKLKGKSPLLQGLFLAAFPLFFLLCFSLSPMRINPFEYWPTVGLFATFSVGDLYRYRWFHILFPFYLAILAVGMVTLFSASVQKRVFKLFSVSTFIFLLACGMVSSVKLFSKNDFKMIFYYKGYNYEPFSIRFLLGDFAPLDMQKARLITMNYPDEHQGEAYRCLGTLIANNVLKNSNKNKKIEDYLKKVHPHYLRDFIYGIVRLTQDVPEKEFQPFADILTKKYPDLFYENWGFRNLGYKYYDVLVNEEILFKNIPSVEQWFFRKFLRRFRQEIEDDGIRIGEKNFLREINMIPPPHKHEVVKGIGKLVGADMLFDPLHVPDYPLDSQFGEKLSGSLREAFYEGVGSGFAETLCRFWRMLLLPKDVTSPLYRKMLDIEWERCQALMSQMLPAYYPLIKKGFLHDLESRHFSPGIQNYLNSKFKRTENSLFQGDIWCKKVS